VRREGRGAVEREKEEGGGEENRGRSAAIRFHTKGTIQQQWQQLPYDVR